MTAGDNHIHKGAYMHIEITKGGARTYLPDLSKVTVRQTGVDEYLIDLDGLETYCTLAGLAGLTHLQKRCLVKSGYKAEVSA